jgi:selenium binding protein SBP56
VELLDRIPQISLMPDVEKVIGCRPRVIEEREHDGDWYAAGDCVNPQIVKVIEPETLAARTGYASPHTVHCGPDGILMNALGAPDGATLDPSQRW